MRRRTARPFTGAELARIEAMLDDGVSYKEVARTVDRHASTILRRFPHRSAWSNTSGGAERQRRARLERIAVPA